MQRDEGRDNRSRSMSGSHPHAGQHPAIYECITIYGNAQEQKCANDIRPACESKIQVREQEFLVQRVLCGYGREE